MAWCRQATSHYLNQCWPSSMLPYDVSRGYHINEWVNLSSNWSLNPTVIIPPLQRSWKGVYWYHLVRLSVCPSVDKIVSALYLQEYSSDPFHIRTSYQATSEGVSRVMPIIHLDSNLSWWHWFHTTDTYCGGWYPCDLAPGHQQPPFWPRPEHNARQSPLWTHWGRTTLICVSKLTIIGSDYGLSPRRLQAIIWTNTGILLIGPIGTNISEILI